MKPRTVAFRTLAAAGTAALLTVGYLAATPLPRAENRYTTPEWIGPVQVVGVETGTITRDRVMRLKAGRITEIVSAAQLDPSARAGLRDVGGAYVSPGLWDMHAVLTRYADAMEQPLNLAYVFSLVL